MAAKKAAGYFSLDPNPHELKGSVGRPLEKY
jgi:hypothetical protein